MNSLVKKGYVVRSRSTEDRRVVHISLSEKGIKAYEHHKYFHEQMIQGVMDVLTEEEMNALVKALTKLTTEESPVDAPYTPAKPSTEEKNSDSSDSDQK